MSAPALEETTKDERIAELERKVAEWERRWNELKWCHSGCRDDSTPNQYGGGPIIGGYGGFL